MFRKYIKIYKALYNLPEFEYREKVDPNFFKSCEKSHDFLVVAISNEKREILLLRDFNKNIGWELPGGHIEENERIEDAANRIVLRETRFFIDELKPIALIKNIFECGEKNLTHFGIAFLASIRGEIEKQPENIKFIFADDIPEKIAYQDEKILKEAKKIVENAEADIPFKEIDSVKKSFLFYLLHKYFIKFLGELSSIKIKKEILKNISDNPKTILDVSCGDDNLIFDLEKIYQPEICVANDISWKITSLIRNRNRYSDVIFTNHDISVFPFCKKFDLIIFKNTLHHISPLKRLNLIKNLSDFSKQLIIVDVEDPSKSNIRAKLWHYYYEHLLNDQGGSFLTFEKFKGFIGQNIKEKKVSFSLLNTIKGKYFVASLIDQLKEKEVEIKVRLDHSKAKSIKRKLLKEGAIFQEKVSETDVYFTAPHRDFIKTRECLRIRERGDYLEITYKGPTTKLMEDKKQFWKSEINIPIFCSKEEAETFLHFLGFIKVAEVKKEREKIILGEQEIIFDKIENLGWFMEIESKASDKKEEKKAVRENFELLRKLGIEEKAIIDEPYRDLVLKNRSE